MSTSANNSADDVVLASPQHGVIVVVCVQDYHGRSILEGGCVGNQKWLFYFASV